jgi:4'-phosphopantetheinyl transferase
MEAIKIEQNLYSLFINKIVKYENSNILNLEEKVRLDTLVSEKRKNEFFTVRMLMRQYIGENTISYKKNGAPYILDGPPISISHSHEYALLATSETQKIGVDIEKIQDKILKLGDKFINDLEFMLLRKNNTELTPENLTKIWCSKEAMYKMCDNDKLSIKNDLIIELLNSNQATCRIESEISEEIYNIDLISLENYIIAVTIK